MLLISTSWTNGLGISSASASSGRPQPAAPRRRPIGSVPKIASDDPIDLRRPRGQPNPASERNLIHGFGDCLTVAKSVLPPRPDLHRTSITGRRFLPAPAP